MKIVYKYLTFIAFISAVVTSCEIIDDAGPADNAISKLEGQ